MHGVHVILQGAFKPNVHRIHSRFFVRIQFIDNIKPNKEQSKNNIKSDPGGNASR